MQLQRRALIRSTSGSRLCLRPLQPSVLIDSLSKAAVKADEDSDALYEKFSAGGCTVDSFLAQYVKARTLYHQRELKCQAAQQTL